jgi:RNA polymerase sigma-70 factor, ECF subfamily
MESRSEQRLLKQARSGAEEALMQLFDRHHRPLFRFAYRLTGSVADAEDIVQECFLALLGAGNGYRPADTPLRAYLFGAVRNQASKRWRERKSNSGQSATPVDYRSPETATIQEQLRRAVERSIGQLPETQREALILAHYEKMPLAEIAEVLAIDVGAVKSRLQRARAALREALADYAPAAHIPHQEQNT